MYRASMSLNSPLDLLGLTEKAATLVRQVARAEVLPRFRRLRSDETERKPSDDDPDDVVTVVDRRVEKLLTAQLRQLLPGSFVVGEEACAADPVCIKQTASAGLVWVVDPLDGTRNFVDGKESFGSMLALLIDGATALSVIYLPVTDELYTAVRGAGARCNGETIVAPAAARTPKLAMMHTKFLREAEFRSTIERRAQAMSLILPAGSAAVAYTDLVRQRFDLAFYARLLPWDHAPGVLLLEECGGKAADLDGAAYAPQSTYGHFLVATSPNCWDEARFALVGEPAPAH